MLQGGDSPTAALITALHLPPLKMPIPRLGFQGQRELGAVLSDGGGWGWGEAEAAWPPADPSGTFWGGCPLSGPKSSPMNCPHGPRE